MYSIGVGEIKYDACEIVDYVNVGSDPLLTRVLHDPIHRFLQVNPFLFIELLLLVLIA